MEFVGEAAMLSQPLAVIRRDNDDRVLEQAGVLQRLPELSDQEIRIANSAIVAVDVVAELVVIAQAHGARNPTPADPGLAREGEHRFAARRRIREVFVVVRWRVLRIGRMGRSDAS